VSPQLTRSLCLITKKEYINQRDLYNQQLTDLRKQWAADYSAEQERLDEEKRLEIERAILRKAIRLREKRQDSERRNELKRIAMEKIRLNYREHLARLSVRAKQKDEVRRARLQRLIEQLEAESKYWITPQNMEEKITEELFQKPCTTGVVTKYSEFWRYYCRSSNVNRTLIQIMQDMNETPGSDSRTDSVRARMEERARKNTMRKEAIAHMLNGMIGTGKDRERYEEFVDGFSSFVEKSAGPVGSEESGKFENGTKLPDLNNLTRTDMMELFGDSTDEFSTQQLKDELDKILGDREELFPKKSSAAKELFPMDDSDSESDSSSDDEHEVTRSDSPLPRDDNVGEELDTSSGSSDEGEDDTSEDSSSESSSDDSEDSSDEIEDDRKMYATADAASVEELIEDVEFVDENDVDAVRVLYEKIKRKALNQQQF